MSVTAVCFQTFLQESLIGRNVFVVGIGCAERMPLVVEQDIERLGISAKLDALQVAPFVSNGTELYRGAVLLDDDRLRKGCLLLFVR